MKNKKLLADIVKYFHVAWVIAVIVAVCFIGDSIHKGEADSIGGAADYVAFFVVIGTSLNGIIFGTCPLTLLEAVLRGEDGSDDKSLRKLGFICYYAKKICGIDIDPGFVTFIMIAICLLTMIALVPLLL